MSKGRCQNLIGISLYKMSMRKLTPSPTTAGTSDQFRDAIEFREPRPDFSIEDELHLMSKNIYCANSLSKRVRRGYVSLYRNSYLHGKSW